MTSIPDKLGAALADRYRLEERVGEGGMSIVYRAHDSRHDRKVAVKVLRPELSAVIGADRFLQEIRVTANLQHPHILPLYDSGSADGLLYYVMPFIPGESLRVKLEREQQLAVDETVALLRAVAGALDYAHRQGVIHRDVKPENILIHEGQPTVTDFGIALAVKAAGGDRLTQTGLSLGTPQYMSPEQAAGELRLDGRTDQYALACVGYEALAGRPPHVGPTAQAIISSIMSVDPIPLGQLRPRVPASVSNAIDRALSKIPADRYATAAQFADALVSPSTQPSPAPARRAASSKAGWIALGIVGLALLGLWAGGQLHLGPSHVDVSERRWTLLLSERAPIALTGPGPNGGWQTALAITPLGDVIAYVADDGGTTRLFTHWLDRDSAMALPGTEGAFHPFFSPDGAWIGYFSGNQLRKIQISGRGGVTLARVDRPVGATWATPDQILLFEQDGFSLRRLNAAGGGKDSTVSLSTQFGTPDLLPGKRWAVGQLSSGQLALLSLDTYRFLGITRRGVVPIDSMGLSDLLFGMSPKWVPSGHLVFGTGDGMLAAVPFDPRQRRTLGPPVPVLSGVRLEEGLGFGEYALAGDGTLVFVPGANQNYGKIAFLDRAGRLDTLPFPRSPYRQLRVSPDGRRLAVQNQLEVGGWEVVVLELATGQRRRIPIEGNYRAFPASWTPTGEELLIGLWDPVQFINHGSQMYSLTRGPLERLGMTGVSYMSIAPNGRELAYSDWRTGEVYVQPLRGDTAGRVRLPGRGFAVSYSPDGKWLAWGDLDGGISVSAMPPTGTAIPVVERGQQPLWSPKGDRIIYRDGRRFYEVDITTANGLHAGSPRLIAEGPFVRNFAWNQSMAPDGRLAVLVALPEPSRRDLRAVTGFPQELSRLAPRGNR